MTDDDTFPEDDLDEYRLREPECEEILNRLFPRGLAGQVVLSQIATEGWERSPFLRVLHPTPDGLFRQAKKLHQESEEFQDPSEAAGPPSTFEEAVKNAQSYPRGTRPVEECEEIVGRCLWDIFSDNHDVWTPEGRIVHLGSFRGTGGFLADWLNAKAGMAKYNYLDFYMGSGRLGARVDIAPIYRLIFRRVKSQNLGWIYHFPKLGIAMFEKPGDDTRPIEEYDPSQALTEEEERKNRAQEAARLMVGLDEDYRKAVEQARENDPPDTVQTYREVYGHLPRGWPPGA